MTQPETLRHKYPRLFACMAWQAILSPNEAASAIIAHRQGDGRWGGSEAVVHYGGATKIIQDSFRHRHIVRELNGGTIL